MNERIIRLKERIAALQEDVAAADLEEQRYHSGASFALELLTSGQLDRARAVLDLLVQGGTPAREEKKPQVCTHCSDEPGNCEMILGRREARNCDGLERDGWSIICGSTDYGAADLYTNVNFCPWCGRKLEDRK